MWRRCLEIFRQIAPASRLPRFTAAIWVLSTCIGAPLLFTMDGAGYVFGRLGEMSTLRQGHWVAAVHLGSLSPQYVLLPEEDRSRLAEGGWLFARGRYEELSATCVLRVTESRSFTGASMPAGWGTSPRGRVLLPVLFAAFLILAPRVLFPASVRLVFCAMVSCTSWLAGVLMVFGEPVLARSPLPVAMTVLGLASSLVLILDRSLGVSFVVERFGAAFGMLCISSMMADQLDWPVLVIAWVTTLGSLLTPVVAICFSSSFLLATGLELHGLEAQVILATVSLVVPYLNPRALGFVKKLLQSTGAAQESEA